MLEDVGSGDREAYSELYDGLSGRVYGLAQRVSDDARVAVELAQDALVGVWEQAPRYDAQAEDATSWVSQVVVERFRARLIALREHAQALTDGRPPSLDTR